MSNDRQSNTDSESFSADQGSAVQERPTSQQSRAGRSRSPGRKWALWILIVLLLLVAGLILLLRFAALPIAVSQANQWYGEQGEGYGVTLEDWDMSLIHGQLSLSGLRLTHPGKQMDETRLHSLSVDLDFSALFDQEILVESAQVSGLFLKAEQSKAEQSGAEQAETELQIAGLSFPLNTSETDAKTETASEPESSDWVVALNKIEFKDLAFQWQQEGLSTAVTLQSLTTDRISTRLNAQGQVDPFNIELAIQLQKLAMTAPESIQLDKPLSLKAQGEVSDWLGAEAGFGGDFSIGELAARWSPANAELDQLLGWKGLQFSDLQASASQQSIGQLKLKVLSVGSDKKGQNKVEAIQLQQLMIPGLQFNGSKLVTGLIELSGLHINSGMLVENDTSTLIGLPAVSLGADSGSKPASEPKPEETKPEAANSETEAVQSASVDDSSSTSLPVELELGGLKFSDLSLGWTQPGIATELSSAEIELSAIHSASIKNEDGTAGITPINLEGTLTLSRFEMNQQGEETRLEKPLELNWVLAASNWLAAPVVSGELALSELSVSLPGEMTVANEGTQLNDITINVNEQSAALSLAIQQLALRLPGQPDLDIGEILLNRIQATADQQSLDALVIQDLHAVANNQAETKLLDLKQYRISDIRFTGDQLSTGIQDILGLKLYATLTSEGALQGVASGSANNTETAEQTSAASSESSETSTPQDLPVRIQVAGIRIQNNDQAANTSRDEISEVHWRDQSVTPNVVATVRIRSLELGGQNKAGVQQGLDSKAWLTWADVESVPAKALLSLDKYNRIELSANMGKQANELEGDLKLSVDQLDLVPFSPYMVQSIGYEAVQGMVQLSSNVKISKGQLDGKARLRLKNSKFEPADKATIARVSKQISMPVETALSVLKDDNNNIKMDIPITGPIDNPDVGIDDLISQISKTAVRSATLYYLQQSLQPYGTLLSLASFAKDTLFAIRLDPLSYETGVATLTEEQTDYLAKVKDIMNSKTQLELRVCPFVSPAEVESQGEQWNRLALDRSTAVKDWLNQYKDEKDRELGKRISLCTPRQGKTASVEMGF